MTMPFHVRDIETDTLVRQLASRKGIGLTDAVKLAVANELQRIDAAAPLAMRLAPLVERVQARRVQPDLTDKAFFDEMSGDA